MRRFLFILLCLLTPVAALSACQPAAFRTAAPADPALAPLFERLAEAPTAAEAEVVEAQIWAIWTQSGSATVDVLMERADMAEAGGNKAMALRFVTEAGAIAPSYAQAFYRRSILRYQAEDRAGAIADIEETLKREPRHFGALAGLGLIREDMGQPEAALDCYRRALEINPWLDTARQGVQRLEPAIEGQDI